MSIWEAFILGCVQAFTEFLPVSSSGHLVLTQAVLGVDLEGGASFEVAVHLGTLLSVVCLFWKEVTFLIQGGLPYLRTAWPLDRQQEWSMLMRFIILGSIPAGVIGILFKDELESAFGNVKGVGAALCITGVILLSTWKKQGKRTQIGFMDALLIGGAQAVAILPGISRSGSTIAMALFLNISRTRAARLSFLLSLPVVGGAGLLKALDLVESPPTSQEWIGLCVGAGTSFVVGLGALWGMLKWVESSAFSFFGIYCLGVGGYVLVM